MIPDPIPLLADLEAEARRRGWTDAGTPNRWERAGALMADFTGWMAPPDRITLSRDTRANLDAALTAWATADAKRLGWVRDEEDENMWIAPESYGDNCRWCVQGVYWYAPNRPDARNDAPDEPTAVRRALDAWLRARESVPAPAEADRPASGELPARCEGCDNAHVAHSESVWSHTCGEELPPPGLVNRARAAGLERVPAWATAYWHFPDTGAARVYSVGGAARAWVAWEVGEFASEADALRAWLDSREGAGRPAGDDDLHIEIGRLTAERDAATQEADRLRTRLVDAEAERDRLRRGLLTEFSLAEAELDRDALLAYLAYTGGCTHEGIGLPGCPTCEGRWTRDVRAAVHAHRDAGLRDAEVQRAMLSNAHDNLAHISKALGVDGYGEAHLAIEKLQDDLAEYRDAAKVIEELTGDTSPGSLRGLLGDLEAGCRWLEDAGICTEGTPYPDVMRAAAEEITALRGRLIALRREMARGAA